MCNKEAESGKQSEKMDAEAAFDSVLAKDDSNFYALYGKSLIFYKTGKIDEASEFLSKSLAAKPPERQFKVNEFRKMLDQLLEPKQPVRVNILDELMRKNPNFRKSLDILMALHPPKQVSSAREEVITLQSTHKPSAVQQDAVKNKFGCSICPKSFNKVYSLNRHMCLHSGIKKHSCR